MACLIAAPASGSGKTLLSLSLIAWARRRGLSLQPFKVGPDYLDPQLLGAAAGRPCRNLDLPLCSTTWVHDSFHSFGGNADLALVEGVMGLYDGIGPTSEGSSAAVAKLLNLPVVLVVDAGGQAQSLAAVVRGFQLHDPDLHLAGVVLNRVSTARHRQLMQEVLDGIGVPLLGCLPRHVDLDLPSRHLGLAPAHEIDAFRQRLDAWAQLAEENLRVDALLPLLSAPKGGPNPVQRQLEQHPQLNTSQAIPVAVAQDQAFHFRYPELQDWLEALNLPVVPWQPLADEPPPQEAQGLILPGGFPELHAEALSRCSRSLDGLRQWFGRKPIYAECGGMLLLGQSLTDAKGNAHAMAGLLPFHARKGQLQVGYRRLEAHHDGLLLRQGDQLMGHEFHRWELSAEFPGDHPAQDRTTTALNTTALNTRAFSATDVNATDFSATANPPNPAASAVGRLQPLWQIEGWHVPRRREGWSHPSLHASWVHLHWGGSSTISCRWRGAVEAAAMKTEAVLSPATKSNLSTTPSDGG